MAEIVGVERKIFFWLVLSGLVFGFVWLFRDVLTPFVLGAAIAYLLHPATTRLTRLKMPRWLASSLILLTFFVFVGALGTLILPLAIREAADLVQSLPAYIDQFIIFLTPYLSLIQNHLGEGYVDQAKALLSQNAGKILTLTGGVLGQLAQGGQAAVGALTTIILTPLVAFFMMNEWPRMTAWVDDLYPREDCGPLRDMMHRIDQKLSGFVRGQITVALMLGTLYALTLMIAGLNYGFLIGVISGVLSIIPLVGSTVGLLMGVLVAWLQTGGDWVYVGTIALIFLGGQMIEGNILTPKLVGDSVGLHPLWVMFALMAGAALFGILGMLLAVPVAAIVGVLAGAGIAQYKSSALYGRPPVSSDTP